MNFVLPLSSMQLDAYARGCDYRHLPYRDRPHFKGGPFLLASLLAGVAALMPVARHSLLKYSTHSLMVCCMQLLDSPCKHCAAVPAGLETDDAGAVPALRCEI